MQPYPTGMVPNPLALEQWRSTDGCRDLEEHWRQSEKKHEAESIIGEMVAGIAPAIVVDLGCGPGRLVPYLGAFIRYYGFDISPYLLDSARRTYGGDARCAFVERDLFSGAPYVLPFGRHLRQPVDLLLSVDTSRHYPDPLGMLAKIVELWPARAYLFSVLHGPTQQELINGVVLPTAEVESGLPAIAAVRAFVDQPIPDGLVVRYAVLEGKHAT